MAEMPTVASLRMTAYSGLEILPDVAPTGSSVSCLFSVICGPSGKDSTLKINSERHMKQCSCEILQQPWCYASPSKSSSWDTSSQLDIKKKTRIYQARHHPHLAVCLVCAVSQFSLAFEECLSSFKQSSLALQLESTTALLPVSGFQYC